MKLSRALAGGTALMFLIGGGAVEASVAHGAVAASVKHEASAGTSAAGQDAFSEVLGKRKHHRHKRHHRRHRHHVRHQARPAAGSIYTGTTGRWPAAVNTRSQAAVNAAYWRDYATGLNVPTGYSASDSACQVGSTSAASLTATRSAVNFVRSLGGLAPVAFSTTLNARSQRTALMMSANRRLSHAPSPSWRCYTGVGAANAGRSNLALAYPSITSAGVVGLYMQDAGSENFAAGHRRWLMDPFTTMMGSGSTNTANAITVIGPTSSARPNPTFVSWPTAGYFPDTLEPSGRWSVSAGSSQVSFAAASVAVYRNGARIPATKLRVENGYGQPTMVFDVPASQARSGTYTVAVRNIRAGGRAYGYSYTVRMFTPTH
ncbi:MAG: CAP domain-containing protein [Marmoricola sp.]|nr:CAP domain-containing protein [Marmoricola sp.]